MDTNQLHFDILNHLQTGVVVHAPDTQIVYCNACACALLGLSEDQLFGKTARDPAWNFLTESGAVMLVSDYPVNRVLASGAAITALVLGINASVHPQTVWVLVGAFAVRDAAGAVVQVVVDFHDITQRQLAGQQLHLRDAFTASVLDSLEQHVAVLDKHGVIVAVNQAWRNFACGNGASPVVQSPVGMSYLGTCGIDPNAKQPEELVQASTSADGIRAVLSGALPSFTLEYPCDSPTEKRWFQMTVTPLDCALGGAVVSHQNITGQRLVELEAQRNMALLVGSIEAIDEAFVIYDADERLVYCNDKYRRLYPPISHWIVPGVTFEDIIRHGAEIGFYKDSIGRVDAWVQERLVAFRSGNVTRIQRAENGRVVRAVERKMASGHTVGFRVDITELVNATDAAQAAARAKGQFLATMSHEIRTPMNAILGMLQLLQNTDLTGQQLDYTAKAQSAAKSLLGLINDVLDFSKVEAGKMVLDNHAFRLDRMLRDLSVILASSVTDKPVDVLFDIDPALPEVVQGDATRLRQVLINLGSNAVKFTPSGQVVIALRLKSLAHEVADIEFCVQDSGIGIAPENQQHIFEGFSQAEASTTRRFGGTGLGLPISQRLVQLMGGTLVLSSQPGRGTTFSFVLPLALVREIPADLVEAPRNTADKRRALVVDDNPLAAALMQQMVQSWGWLCDCSPDGVQALGCIAVQCGSGRFPYDVIYLDCQMEPMDGWDTARAIRQCCAAQDGVQPSLIMISSLGRDALAHRSPREQELVNSFLVRPVTASMLLDAVIDPLHAKAHSRHTEKLRSGERRLDKLRLLVVEDNLINQQVAEELLAAEGALVALAANGRLGVEAVAAARPPFDAVLMDIQMPVLDGYAATREIRDVLGHKTLPIIAMTANALESDRHDCLAAGMDEHVGKPFDVQHLVAVILRLTRGVRPPN